MIVIERAVGDADEDVAPFAVRLGQPGLDILLAEG
jgi:hypothetical protein